MTKHALALSWSGGKDSALALWRLREEGISPYSLVSTVNAGAGRLPMHEVRRELLRSQAECVSVPLMEIEIPAPCPDRVYEQRMAAAFHGGQLDAVREMAFGDLFLADIRAYREARLAAVGVSARFPLWGLDTTELAREFIALGFCAVLVCVDTRVLSVDFVGREFDENLLDEMPSVIDPCGENGEFHTFVYDGPVFERPVEWARGELSRRDRFAFCDLLAGARV